MSSRESEVSARRQVPSSERCLVHSCGTHDHLLLLVETGHVGSNHASSYLTSQPDIASDTQPPWSCVDAGKR